MAAAWVVYGEGPSVAEKAEAGHFGGARDVRSKPYTAEDIRFTTKANTLYALVMELPAADRTVLIKSLATNSPHVAGRKVAGVALLGHAGSIVWTQDETGLRVRLPDALPGGHTLTLKISGVL